MRAVIQRVKSAKITIDYSVERSIEKGLLILLGIESDDDNDDIKWLAGKIARLRVFSDKDNKMNLPLLDISGEVMVVSQFTLHASTKKGNTPSWIKAANPEMAKPLYNKFVKVLSSITNKDVLTGEFGAHMDIELINDGPVTIIMDTKNKE